MVLKNKLMIHGVVAADFTIERDPTGYYILNNVVIVFAKRDTISYEKICEFKKVRFRHKPGEMLNGLKIRRCLVDRRYRKYYFFVNSNYIKHES